VQQVVTAQAGATNNLVVFMSTSGKVVGRVTNSAGAGLGGASVQMVGGRLPTTKTVTADKAGYYSSGYIPVGSYTVTASATGYASKSSKSNVSTGATTTTNFMLQ
jgi:hypothetical protein